MGDSEHSSSRNYKYSKNPFAHQATASWAPITREELREIFERVSAQSEQEYLLQ
jgi:hypothetical protein